MTIEEYAKHIRSLARQLEEISCEAAEKHGLQTNVTFSTATRGELGGWGLIRDTIKLRRPVPDEEY